MITKLKTIEVKGKKFEVEVDDRGLFRALFDHDLVTAATLADLITKLTNRISRSKIKLSIPFVRWHREQWKGTGELRRGVITGLHAANKNILVKWDATGESEQESGYSSRVYVQPEHAEKLEALGRALTAASLEYDAFIEEHSFDAVEEIKKALGGKDPDAE